MEFRYTFEKKWQLRVRPLSTVQTAGVYRHEFMFGKILSPNWKVFSYTQLDFKDDIHHSGIRIDYNNSFLKKRLNTYNQLRTFFGLNETSKFQTILIPDLHYRFIPKVSMGVRNFSVFTPSVKHGPLKLSNSYLGPLMWLYPHKKISILTYYGQSLMKSNSFLAMLVGIVTIR